MPDAGPTVYTIGHSNHPIATLLALLDAHGVRILIDVRAFPRSHRHPHFDRGALQRGLPETGIEYRWEGRDLGGFRRGEGDPRDRALAPGLFRAYAAHMRSPSFATAIGRVTALAAAGRCAIMCAEADPASCHRRFIADYLSAHGVTVRHIRTAALAESHRRHPRLRLDGARLVYDGGTQAVLDL
jgi:uncharacterized protein (DUF488 family)